MSRVRAFALTFAIASLVSQEARAVEPDPTQIEAARRLYEEAMEAEQRGDFVEAEQKLERSAAVKLTASVRFHLALCEEKQGRLVSALTRYQGALDQALVEKKLEVAKVAEAATVRLKKIVPLVTLRVAGDAKQLPESVTLDGRVVASALYDTGMRVEPGVHRVEARREGHRSFFEVWDTRAGEEHTIDIVLSPDPTAVTLKRVVIEPAASPINASARIALGIGVSAIALGTVSYFAASALESDARKGCATALTASCSDHPSSIRALDLGAIAFWSVGLVGLGTSVYFFARGTRPESPPNRVSSELRWSPGRVTYERTF